MNEPNTASILSSEPYFKLLIQALDKMPNVNEAIAKITEEYENEEKNKPQENTP